MPEDTIAEIKSKINIVDLVQSYVPLTKSGKNYKAICPFHNEKTPSFMVSPEVGIYKCFGCGRGGDIFSFVQEIDGVNFSDALKMLAQKVGVKLQSNAIQSSPEELRRERLLEINHLAGEYFHYLLTSHEVGKKALLYLTERGFSPETIKTFNLGYAPESWDSLGKFLLKKGYGVEEVVAAGLIITKEQGRGFYDRFRGRVIFPFYSSSGRLIAFTGRILTAEKDQPKYLNSPETPVFTKSRFLYGLHLSKTEIKRAGFVLLVEGQTDLITPFQAGIKNIVATGGTALTREQLQMLKRYTENLHLCFDADLAGNSAMQRGIALAESLGINLKVVVLPPGVKDPDEAARQDLPAFRQAVEGAVSVYDYYFLYAQKQFPGRGGLEKKSRSQFLLPVISGISNEVQKAHYVSRLSGELGVGESVIWKDLSRVSLSRDKQNDSEESAVKLTKSRTSVSEYILSLLLKSSLNSAQTILHKLGQKDFPDPLPNEIFVALKDYLIGRKRPFEIAVFLKKLSDEAKEKAEELYLLEGLEEDPSSAVWDRELDQIFARLKKETTHRQMVELSEKIKELETEGRTQEVAKLQAEFGKLGQKSVEFEQ